MKFVCISYIHIHICMSVKALGKDVIVLFKVYLPL